MSSKFTIATLFCQRHCTTISQLDCNYAVEMHCANSTGNSEAGLKARCFVRNRKVLVMKGQKYTIQISAKTSSLWWEITPINPILKCKILAFL